jgi:hypothetical protein
LKKLCVIACLLSTVALAACGGGASDEAADVEAAIRASVVDPDPSACTELRTRRYLEQAEQKPAKAALKNCEEKVGDPANPTESVTISEVEVEVDGEAASALVAAEGGPLDGQVVELELVEEQEQWKLDQVARFVEFDGSALVRATEKTLKAEDGAPFQVSCVGGVLEEMSRRQVEALVLSPRVPEEAEELLRPCITGSGSTATGERISPEGAEYSYLVPAGFTLAEPQARFQPATAASAIALLGAEGAGQGVLVGQFPGVPIRTRAQLLRALPAIDAEFKETAALVGAAATPAEVLEVDGRLAVQRETKGGTVGPFPGTDYRETVIFAKPETVVVVCRWKGAGEERDAILEGCDSVIRSLRLFDPNSLATSS